MPLQMCAEPQCPELVQSGRCAKHQRERDQAVNRRFAAEKGSRYTTAAWRMLRRSKLNTDPFCQIGKLCAGRSMTERIATEVDHIQPVREHPELQYEWTNLQSACKRCHSWKTQQEVMARR